MNYTIKNYYFKIKRKHFQEQIQLIPIIIFINELLIELRAMSIEQRPSVSIKVGKLFELVEEISTDIYLSEEPDLELGLYPSNTYTTHVPHTGTITDSSKAQS